jgi:hypothetical protein
MMISSVPSTSTTAALAAARPPHQGPGPGPFDSVSSLLDMSVDDIASAVRSGTSLDDLAKDKGVSHDDLVAALKAGAPQELQGTSQLDGIVAQIASATGTDRPTGPPPPPPPSGVMSGSLTSGQQSTLDALSSLLDMSSDDLQSSLQSGTSLVGLLQDKGIDLSDVAGALQSGFMVDVRS